MRVEPSGPVPCDLAIFGEAPGFEEQQIGEGFVGKAGKELWAGMKRFVGLTRDDFYISNLIKEGLPKNRDPKPAEVAAALPEFIDEILTVQPRVVVTAGAFATKAILGNVPMANVHGIPHEAEIAGHKFICMPIYHPAAGLHNKGFLAAFAYDLGRLNDLLAGKLAPWAPSDCPVETSWLTPAGMRACERIPADWAIGLDTEGWEDKPRMLSFSPDGQHGYVIRANDTLGLAWFSTWLTKKKLVPAIHNSLYDIPVLAALSVNVGAFRQGLHDTQVLAYHDIIRSGSGVLEAESQNLGTLAYRECRLSLGELTDCPAVDLVSREIPFTDDVMHYAALDAIAARRLLSVYTARGLTQYEPYQIDMGQIDLVDGMIGHGLPFDVDATTDYFADVIDKLEACTADLKARAARMGNRDFNPGSHDQVRELITRKIGLRIRKRTKGGKASTNEKALADHKGHPFVEKLQEHRELVKLKGTYIIPLLDELLA